MAVSAFQKVMNKLLQQFVKANGRHPQTPKEFMNIQNEAVQFFNRTKGVPPGPKKPPFQGWKPEVIQGGKEIKKDRPSIRLIKNFDQELDDITLAQEGYNLQEIGILKRARDVMKKEGENPDDALQWVRSEMADDAGIEFEEFMPDFDWGDFPGKAEGGIARAGFPFGGRALKAIRDAWRANKTWGVGGPPYKPEMTSFDIKALTKQNLGEEYSLKELKEISESPFARSTKQPKFEEFNQEFKIIKARILKQKLKESKLQAEAMILSTDMVPTKTAIEKRVAAQFTREGKKQLEEAKEGLKEIDIYMGMLQKKGRSVHESGGLAYMLGEPTYMKADGGRIGLKKGSESWRQKLTRWAGGTSALAGELGLEGVHQLHSLLGMGGLYSGGGQVGHGPWTTGQVPQQQPQPQQAPSHPQQGQPNPMKMPQGIPSAAPRSMDPRVMQQQMMQKAMMGQGQQGQRPRMQEGGPTPEEFWNDKNYNQMRRWMDEYEQYKKHYDKDKQRRSGIEEAAQGGRVPFFAGKVVKGIRSIAKKAKVKAKVKEKSMFSMTKEEKLARLKKYQDETGIQLSYGNKDAAAAAEAAADEGIQLAILKGNFERKYTGIIDDTLMKQVLADNDPQRISEIMATIDQSLIMQKQGMKPDTIMDTFLESWNRKKQASGGRVPLMYGGDPGFAFEYGGSWADWHDQHRNQMPVEDYIQTKLPKERLPFRDAAQTGGRIGFGLGGINKGRRAFMKWLAAIMGTGVAAGTGLLKVAKPGAKVVPKVTETIVKSNASGMPAWFSPLVKRVIKEGEDITKTAGVLERQTVHRATMPSGTPVEVMQDLTSGNVIVDIGEQTKHGWKDGFHGQSTRLVLKKGEWIEPDISKSGKVTTKPKKTQDEFMVEEAEFTGGHPENIKFEESTIEKYGEHGSDFTEVEKFATGKTTKGSKAQKQVWEADWDDSLPDYEEFASGGLAHMLGE